MKASMGVLCLLIMLCLSPWCASANTNTMQSFRERLAKLLNAGFRDEAREIVCAKTNDPDYAALAPELFALCEVQVAPATNALSNAVKRMAADEEIDYAIKHSDYVRAAHLAYAQWQQTQGRQHEERYRECIGWIAAYAAVSNIVLEDSKVEDDQVSGTWVNHNPMDILSMEIAVRIKREGVVLAEENDTVVYSYERLKAGQQRTWSDYFTPPKDWRGELDVAVIALQMDVTNMPYELLSHMSNLTTDILHVFRVDSGDTSTVSEKKEPDAAERCPTPLDVFAYGRAMRAECSEKGSLALVKDTIAYVDVRINTLEKYSNDWVNFLASTQQISSSVYHKKSQQANASFQQLHKELSLAHRGMTRGRVYYQKEWLAIPDALALQAQAAFRASFNMNMKKLPPGFVGDDFIDTYKKLRVAPQKDPSRVWMFVTTPDDYNDTPPDVSKRVDEERIILHTILLDESQYSAQNGFGAQVEVTKRFTREYLVKAEEIDSFLSELNAPKSVEAFSFALSDTVTKNVQQRARILIICKIYGATEGSGYIEPAFKSPYEWHIEKRIIQGKIIGLWLFDSTTGAVLSKHPERASTRGLWF